MSLLDSFSLLNGGNRNSPFSLGFAPDHGATTRRIITDYFLRNLPLTETERIFMNPDRMILRHNNSLFQSGNPPSGSTGGSGAGVSGNPPSGSTGGAPTQEVKQEQYKLGFGDADWNEFAKGMVNDVFNNPGYSTDLRMEILRARNTGYITDSTIRRYYEERAALDKRKQEQQAQTTGAAASKSDDWFDPRMFWMMMLMRFAFGNNQGGF